MFGKAMYFLAAVAINGVVALLVSILLCIILAAVSAFAMIPVSIIAGDGVANAISHFTDGIEFRWVYAIVFISLMLDDLMGIINYKKTFKKCIERRKN